MQLMNRITVSAPHVEVICTDHAIDEIRVSGRTATGIEFHTHATVCLGTQVRRHIDAVTCATHDARSTILAGDRHSLIGEGGLRSPP